MDFPHCSLELFEAHKDLCKRRGKRVIRAYRDWILNAVKTHKLEENKDFIIHMEKLPGGVRRSKIYWLSSSPYQTLQSYIQDPAANNTRVVAAKNKFIKIFAAGRATCAKCHTLKSVNDFRIDRKSKSYVHFTAVCVACSDAAKARRRTVAYKKLDNSLRVPLYNALVRAKKMGWEFNLTLPLLLGLWHKQNGLCVYSGQPMHYARIARSHYPVRGGFTKNNPDIVSIDRVDSEKGYTIDNIVLCRWAINAMKSNLDTRKFYEIVKQTAAHLHQHGL